MNDYREQYAKVKKTEKIAGRLEEQILWDLREIAKECSVKLNEGCRERVDYKNMKAKKNKSRRADNERNE